MPKVAVEVAEVGVILNNNYLEKRTKVRFGLNVHTFRCTVKMRKVAVCYYVGL